MITEIGIVSGKILDLLEDQRLPVSITEIKLRLDEPMDLIHMSIGWIIRENYVRVIRGSENSLSLVAKDVPFSEIPQDFEWALSI